MRVGDWGGRALGWFGNGKLPLLQLLNSRLGSLGIKTSLEATDEGFEDGNARRIPYQRPHVTRPVGVSRLRRLEIEWFRQCRVFPWDLPVLRLLHDFAPHSDQNGSKVRAGRRHVLEQSPSE